MIKVFDRNMQLQAILDKASTIGYETPYNGLWSASFTLPANDPKNAECQPFNFVEIYDHDEHIGLFRILPSSTQRTSDGAKVVYQCEHVIATLLDDVLFQYHTVGNLGYYTTQVIEYVLSKQLTPHWQLGTCSFTRQFEYNWENETLFAALFSVPKPFDTPYMWTWDTNTYPWTLNLVEPPTGAETYIRYGHNMTGITKDVDPTNVITRIYPLGYGEGVNQLNIAEINGGVPYLDAPTQAQYGVINKVWVDRRFTSAESLKGRAQAMLDEMSVPRISYKVDAVEYYAKTGDPVHKFRTGREVKVQDSELGIDVTVRVVNVRKQDIKGQPGKVVLELANRTQDIASSLADLDVRQRINEVYAQGATNVNIYELAENCDPTHPAKFRIWVPEEAVRINKVLLTYENEPFRANSRAISSAPATTSGPSSKTTTASGGGETSSPGYWTLIPPQPLIGDFMMPAGDDNHVHAMYSVSHVHTTDVHVHNMDHTHVIPPHTHEIQFGIYEGPTATSVYLLVDDNIVGGGDVVETNLDLVDYLELDDEGKIKRGQWHTIEIIPNTLSRIVANVVIQFFVNSRGGGDY
jgi:phage minor structural protein